MTVLVIETRGATEPADAACRALADRADLVRCSDHELEPLLGLALGHDLDLVVVASDGESDAGHRVCRTVRTVARTPLALVTPSRREADELLAFARGCDDYIPASCSTEVMRARLGGLAARSGRQPPEALVEFGTLQIDPSLRAATVNGEPVALTRIEFDLLHVLLSQQRRVVPRRELLEVGWDGCPPSDHVLDVHLSRLRRKVLRAGGPKVAEPVPGVGYRVGAPAACASCAPASAVEREGAERPGRSPHLITRTSPPSTGSSDVVSGDPVWA